MSTLGLHPCAGASYLNVALSNLHHLYNIHTHLATSGWLRGTVVERRSSAGVLSLSCARPVADR